MRQNITRAVIENTGISWGTNFRTRDRVAELSPMCTPPSAVGAWVMVISHTMMCLVPRVCLWCVCGVGVPNYNLQELYVDYVDHFLHHKWKFRLVGKIQVCIMTSAGLPVQDLLRHCEWFIFQAVYAGTWSRVLSCIPVHTIFGVCDPILRSQEHQNIHIYVWNIIFFSFLKFKLCMWFFSPNMNNITHNILLRVPFAYN